MEVRRRKKFCVNLSLSCLEPGRIGRSAKPLVEIRNTRVGSNPTESSINNADYSVVVASFTVTEVAPVQIWIIGL